MSYSEALERQVTLAAWANGDDVPEEQYRGHVQQALRYGDTFYISPEIGGLLAVAARSYPAVSLTAKDLPTTHGFAWFAKPLPLPPDPYVLGAGSASLNAVAWMPAVFANNEPGMFAAFWVDMEQATWGYGIALWNYGDTWNDFTPTFHGNRYGLDQEAFNKGVVHVKAQRRYLAALFNFVSQRILVPRVTSVERHVRKRVERAGWSRQAIVRVVELRRREQRSGHQAVEPVEREWSCQWVVRGHWRQQFYPSKHRNQPIWITPYVKGPDDKPLKPPRATVFAVVR